MQILAGWRIPAIRKGRRLLAPRLSRQLQQHLPLPAYFGPEVGEEGVHTEIPFPLRWHRRVPSSPGHLCPRLRLPSPSVLIRVYRCASVVNSFSHPRPSRFNTCPNRQPITINQQLFANIDSLKYHKNIPKVRMRMTPFRRLVHGGEKQWSVISRQSSVVRRQSGVVSRQYPRLSASIGGCISISGPVAVTVH